MFMCLVYSVSCSNMYPYIMGSVDLKVPTIVCCISIHVTCCNSVTLIAAVYSNSNWHPLSFLFFQFITVPLIVNYLSDMHIHIFLIISCFSVSFTLCQINFMGLRPGLYGSKMTLVNLFFHNTLSIGNTILWQLCVLFWFPHMWIILYVFLAVTVHHPSLNMFIVFFCCCDWMQCLE
jgi:hypothetical protein